MLHSPQSFLVHATTVVHRTSAFHEPEGRYMLHTWERPRLRGTGSVSPEPHRAWPAVQWWCIHANTPDIFTQLWCIVKMSECSRGNCWRVIQGFSRVRGAVFCQWVGDAESTLGDMGVVTLSGKWSVGVFQVSLDMLDLFFLTRHEMYSSYTDGCCLVIWRPDWSSVGVLGASFLLDALGLEGYTFSVLAQSRPSKAPCCLFTVYSKDGTALIPCPEEMADTVESKLLTRCCLLCFLIKDEAFSCSTTCLQIRSTPPHKLARSFFLFCGLLLSIHIDYLTISN